MAKNTIILYRPDGDAAPEVYTDVEVVLQTNEQIVFKKRTENITNKTTVINKTVTVTTYTSNLKYLISEEVTGSAKLL